MEYTLHSVRKLMIFLPVFKDIITHKLYSRTFSEFFTGSAKLVFSRKKKCQNCTLCIPLAELRKISVLLYIVQKNESSTLFFVITLSLSYDFAPTIKKKTWREIWSYIHRHIHLTPSENYFEFFFCIVHIINICLVIMLNSPAHNGRIVIWMCH